MVFVRNVDRNPHLTYHNITYVDKDFNQVFSYHPSARHWLPDMYDGHLWVNEPEKYGHAKGEDGKMVFTPSPNTKVVKSLLKENLK